jgi:SHS2 domain-containing protein
MTTPHWEHFEHKADIGVRGFGNKPAEAFEQAALAMSAIITKQTRNYYLPTG